MNSKISERILEFQDGSRDSSVDHGITVQIRGFQSGCWYFSKDLVSLVWVLGLLCGSQDFSEDPEILVSFAKFQGRSWYSKVGPGAPF